MFSRKTSEFLGLCLKEALSVLWAALDLVTWRISLSLETNPQVKLLRYLRERYIEVRGRRVEGWQSRPPCSQILTQERPSTAP